MIALCPRLTIFCQAVDTFHWVGLQYIHIPPAGAVVALGIIAVVNKDCLDTHLLKTCGSCLVAHMDCLVSMTLCPTSLEWAVVRIEGGSERCGLSRAVSRRSTGFFHSASESTALMLACEQHGNRNDDQMFSGKR